MDFLTGFYLNRYRFTIRAIDEIILPEYKGSTLRGVFGHALKHTVCAVKHSDCKRCILQNNCVYVFLFETKPPSEHPNPGKFKEYPRPYLFAPPPISKRNFDSGEELSFEITLIGKANDYLPYRLLAFERVGETGFNPENRQGQQSSSSGHQLIRRKRGRFTVMGVESLDINGIPKNIYANGKLDQTGGCRLTMDHINTPLEGAACGIVMHFLHLRYKLGGKLVDTPPEFSLLIERLAQRAELLSYFCAGVDHGKSLEMLADTGQIRMIKKTRPRWCKLQRFSNRQKTLMSQDGIKCIVSYHGDVTPYLPLLRLGEYLNIGKDTVFGLGRYRLEAYTAPNKISKIQLHTNVEE